jgi:hypothetical protein
MMTFEIAAKQTFPELTSTITRKQAQEVCQLTGAKWPNHIINMSNSVGRGVFKFSADLEIEGVVAAPVVVESDKELDARIRTTYSNMELLTKSVGDGITTSMIISGAAGVGKSYTVKKVLEANDQTTVHFIRGYVKATGIYKLLWENRQSHQTLVFDDCDSVFEDAVGLNLLKAALELSKSRRICWMSEKEFVDEDGGQIPNYFDYEGQIIFLTNIDFHELIAKGSKMAPHLSALESRSIYLDLQVRSNREKMMRITQVVGESSILEDRGIYDDEEKELMAYLNKNVSNLRECSLRTVEKLAALYLASPTKWSSLADSVLLRVNR